MSNNSQVSASEQAAREQAAREQAEREQAARQAEYNRLCAEKAGNEAEQQSVQSQIDALDEKIERLRSAYDKIDAEKESLKGIRNDILRITRDYYGDWKGTNASELERTLAADDGELRRAYEAYIEAIDVIEDSINNDILALKQQRNNLDGFLVGLKNAWASLCTRIRNIFN